MEQPQEPHQSRHKNHRHADDHKPDFFRRAEKVLSGNLIKILGIIFLIGSLWFAVNSADKLLVLLKGVSTPGKVLNPATVPVNGGAVIHPDAGAGFMILLLYFLIAASVTALVMFLSTRFRKKEIPRIFIPVFYASLFLLTRKIGWNPNFYFPLILFFSALIYGNRIKLKSSMAGKINVLFAWGFFIIWWGLKIILAGDQKAILPFFIYATLLYLFFSVLGVFSIYKGYHKSSKYTEAVVVIVNIMVFFLICVITQYRYGVPGMIWISPLAMSLQIFVMVMLTEKSDYPRGMYLFPAIILFSLILPLLFMSNFLILFFGILSLLLLVYSRFSKNQPAILISFTAMILMLGIYLSDWVFHYFPFSFLQEVTNQNPWFLKGILAGLVIIIVLVVDRLLLKNLEIRFSKKWFSRKSYLHLLKGVLLAVIYLAAFWPLHFIMMRWLDNETARYLSWFSFSCLYFIFVIVFLFREKSAFLKPFFWIMVLLLVAYPLINNFNIIELRDQSLKHASYSSFPFYFHYLATFLLLIVMAMAGSLITSVFRKNDQAIRILQAFFILLGLYLLLSEYDHFAVITRLKKGIRIEDIIQANRFIPYSVITMIYSILWLVFGFYRSNRFARLLALVMMALVIIKMALYDIKVLSGGMKIGLMFTLGILLLVFSFFYPRIKSHFGRSRHHHHSS